MNRHHLAEDCSDGNRRLVWRIFAASPAGQCRARFEGRLIPRIFSQASPVAVGGVGPRREGERLIV
jgi:hypothetical protein